MKNPIKQLKKVQVVLAEQAYASYCFGYMEGRRWMHYNNPRLTKQEFFKKMKDVLFEGKRLQKIKQEAPITKAETELDPCQKYTEA